MITKEKLKEYAAKLMFDMNDEEYETLEKEFEVILKQMDLIGEIEGIDEMEPMTFPYQIDHAKFRKDEIKDTLETEDALKNAANVDKNQVRVPKVVEEA